MSFLGDMADRFRAEDDGEETDEAWQGHRQAKRARQVADADAEEDEPQRMSNEAAVEIATAIVGWADFGVKKIAGKDYAQDEDDTEILIKVTAPVCQKRLPHDFSVDQVLDLVPPELLMGAVVLYVYGSKHQEVKKRRAAAAAAKANGEQPPPEEKEVNGTVTARRPMRAVS